GTTDSLNACARLLESAPDAAAKQKLLAALDLGLLANRPTAETVPADLKNQLAKLWVEASHPEIHQSTDPLIHSSPQSPLHHSTAPPLPSGLAPLLRVSARLGDRRARE